MIFLLVPAAFVRIITVNTFYIASVVDVEDRVFQNYSLLRYGVEQRIWKGIVEIHCDCHLSGRYQIVLSVTSLILINIHSLKVASVLVDLTVF